MASLSHPDLVSLRWAAGFGLTAVALGAFGAHALKATLTPEALATLDTGVRYQLWHTLALLATVLLSAVTKSPWRRRAAWAFALGMGLFSGSLYLLALVGRAALPGPLILITPLGGLCLMAGWVCLFLCSGKQDSHE